MDNNQSVSTTAIVGLSIRWRLSKLAHQRRIGFYRWNRLIHHRVAIRSSKQLSGEIQWLEDEHNKAAEHHENAAKSHRAAAEKHGKGAHVKGRHSTSAQQQSQNARQHSEQAHTKSQQQK